MDRTGCPCLALALYTLHEIPFKGSVSAISSEPSCRDDNAWFTTVSLKALSGLEWIRCFLGHPVWKA